MKNMCNNRMTWLDKSKIQVLDDGRLLTENDGHVQIYDQGFCVDTIISGSLRHISSFKCTDVNPTKTCTKRNNLHSSCSREELDSQFRLVYSILGGISLVSSFKFEVSGIQWFVSKSFSIVIYICDN